MLEHAWRELRHDQKWCASHSTKETDKSKRRKVEFGSIHSSEASQVHGESEASQARPPGVNAAKGKGKKTANSSPNVEVEGHTLERIQILWDIKQQTFALKQQEHALKDKLTNKKLLGFLLAKSDPFTEIEEELKTKLIREILL
ncbi:unnamed protein product [Arabidopsis arenosa]|uniref:No apical meristem-associated C-terminal domain-containing protein n=1 Tax=Arabidopsis arenosa TaxID=38785 RepID=A0A8S2AC99_ARAAE|nr:unnamed protein product [Arabidopsis arenosa]